MPLVGIVLCLGSVACETPVDTRPETVSGGDEEDADVFGAPTAYVGQEVSVTGRIARRLNPSVFVLRGDSGGRGLLVVHPNEYAYEHGAEVRVEGIVDEFSYEDVPGATTRPDTFSKFEHDAVIQGAVVEPV